MLDHPAGSTLEGAFRRPANAPRTLLVAVSTLAILLVCFSMYQHSQLEPPVPEKPRDRLPSPTIPAAVSDRPGGVEVNGAIIGASQNVKITLYPREGRDSAIELSVSDWSPREGSDHEFLLRDPEIRMRTPEGNAVQIKAFEGMLEAKRRSGSALQPQRGRLSGNVVVEYDRRGAKELARIPEAQRERVSPEDLVRIEAAELLFDVEFGRMTIPGPFEVRARDASLEGRDFEIQFDQVENRVQSLRIDRGGRLELINQNERLSLGVPGGGAVPQRRTLVEWLHSTLLSRLEEEKPSLPEEPAPPRPAFEIGADGVPVFRAVDASPRTAKPARYRGRFEGDVDARQQIGEITQSRLQADILEVLRDFSPQDRGRLQESPQPHTADATTVSAPPASERIIVEWTGALTVNVMLEEGEENKGPSSHIAAWGAPARISNPEGDATCAHLEYLPASGSVHLAGSDAHAVTVRSREQGAIVGRSVSLRQKGDALDILVAGPGALSRAGPATASEDGSTGALSVAERDATHIEFGSDLKARGRVLKKTIVDFTGGVTHREFRLLDEVSFTGRTQVRQDDATLTADSINVEFETRQGWRDVRQFIHRLVGSGNVVLTRGGDRTTCAQIEISMGAGADGPSVIQTATASGSVSALQGDRTLEATDKVIVDFEPLPTAPQNDALAAADTAAAGVPDQAAPASASATVQPSRIRASGNVAVVDPSQGLSVNGDELDCTLRGGDDIQTARVRGRPQRPANVRANTFGVTGEDVTIDVLNEWADVPGEGRMTFLSDKDLDGRKADPPIPIAVTWSGSMAYRGRENRAEFFRDVHASSDAATTFDCDHLLVEFADAPRAEPAPGTSLMELPAVRRLMSQLGLRPSLSREGEVFRRFSKEPRYIEATGDAVAQTASLNSGGFMKSRARISGPRLALHLRSELSKLIIEGAGTLQLEDFQSQDAGASDPDVRRADLFHDDTDGGPSKTLVQWQDRMSYDFSIDQTVFEGGVQLTHLSGAELDKVFGVPSGGTASTVAGRRTFLTSDSLMIDFLEAKSGGSREDQRMGRISSDRLRQFRALGNVSLREEVDQFSLGAHEVIYERPRKLLLIHGNSFRKAQIIKRRPGKLPDQMAAERIFYNLDTGKIEVSGARITSGE